VRSNQCLIHNNFSTSYTYCSKKLFVYKESSHLGWLNLPHSPTQSPRVTARHRVVKFQEMSPRKGHMVIYGEKRLRKKKVLRREWKTLWEFNNQSRIRAKLMTMYKLGDNAAPDWQGTGRI